MQYLKSIPQSDLILLMETAQNLLPVRTTADFENCFKKLQNLFRYDSSICVLSDKNTIRNRKPVYSFCTMNFSTEFAERYAQKFYYKKSSMFKAALNNIGPFHWQTFWSRKNDIEVQSAKELVYSYGYRDGWMSASGYKSDPSVGILVFTGKKVDTDPRTKAIIKYITPHFTESIKATFHKSISSRKQNAQSLLTPRQLEVLKWIKEGKSTWDISVIINRSERVVIWHANNIMHKLGAQNRTHAVAIAMRQKLID